MDFVLHRFVTKLRAETCPHAEIRAYLCAEAMSRESFGISTNLETIANNMRTNFQTKWLARSIEKVENRLYYLTLVQILTIPRAEIP